MELPLPPLVLAPDAALAVPVASSAGLPEASVAAIDRAVTAALAAGKLPGCVVRVGRHDGVLFSRAYGSRSVLPAVTPMSEDTVFDLASLTKPLATAASIVVLADRGLVDLDAPLRKYLPELGDRGVATLRQALTHTAGFVADTPVGDYGNGMPEVIERIARRPLRYVPGSDTKYSDVGFVLLGEIVRRVSGKELDAFAKESVFAPLRMSETGFLPSPALAARAAPTENVEGRWLTGEVHDPRARLLGGVAGHAGLFSTAADLTLFARSMLGSGPTFASARALRGYIAPHDVPHAVRALGWDIRSAFSSNRGTMLSPRAFGHGGYTGTSLWIDPTKDLFVVFLSNRVHPTGHGEINPLAGAIADIAAQALEPTPAPAEPGAAVATGLDVLVEQQFAPLVGRHVGLITNAAGKTREGTRDVDLLAAAKGVTLVAIFAPEHGLATDKDAIIADDRDRATGLPVYSLYGAHFAPTEAQLASLDTLVLDLPDVGTRFFTYASTLHRAMETAAKHGLRFVVLDRPDPLGGVRVEGPMPVGPRSFVNHARLPVRHGLTMGELTLLLDAADHLGTELVVVPARGWRREMLWSDTGLPWTPPSPNLRTPMEALLYPGVGLLEATNLSVGRGTPTPFEVVGAPWIDGPKLAEELARAHVAGMSFEPTTFTPESSTHHGKLCQGLRFRVTDTAALAPVTLGVAVAVALHSLYPQEWEVAKLAPLLMSPEAVRAIERGASAAEVVGSWKAEVDRFTAERAKYLLYRAAPGP